MRRREGERETVGKRERASRAWESEGKGVEMGWDREWERWWERGWERG